MKKIIITILIGLFFIVLGVFIIFYFPKKNKQLMKKAKILETVKNGDITTKEYSDGKIETIYKDGTKIVTKGKKSIVTKNGKEIDLRVYSFQKNNCSDNLCLKDTLISGDDEVLLFTTNKEIKSGYLKIEYLKNNKYFVRNVEYNVVSNNEVYISFEKYDSIKITDIDKAYYEKYTK